MTQPSVGETIAERRASRVPCGVCERAGCAELLDHRRRGDDEFERLRCTTRDLTFRRVWVNR